MVTNWWAFATSSDETENGTLCNFKGDLCENHPETKLTIILQTESGPKTRATVRNSFGRLPAPKSRQTTKTNFKPPKIWMYAFFREVKARKK